MSSNPLSCVKFSSMFKLIMIDWNLVHAHLCRANDEWNRMEIRISNKCENEIRNPHSVLLIIPQQRCPWSRFQSLIIVNMKMMSIYKIKNQIQYSRMKYGYLKSWKNFCTTDLTQKICFAIFSSTLSILFSGKSGVQGDQKTKTKNVHSDFVHGISVRVSKHLETGNEFPNFD